MKIGICGYTWGTKEFTKPRSELHSTIELEFGNVTVFEERGKPEYPGKLLSESKTNNKRNPHMTPCPGIEPGTQLVGGHQCAIPASLKRKSESN